MIATAHQQSGQRYRPRWPSLEFGAQCTSITDGDTSKFNGWRLWGIDARETKQWCGDYPVGALATAALDKLMKGRDVTCEDRGHDRYGA